MPEVSFTRDQELVPEEAEPRPLLEILEKLRQIEQEILQGIKEPKAMPG